MGSTGSVPATLSKFQKHLRNYYYYCYNSCVRHAHLTNQKHWTLQKKPEEYKRISVEHKSDVRSSESFGSLGKVHWSRYLTSPQHKHGDPCVTSVVVVSGTSQQKGCWFKNVAKAFLCLVCMFFQYLCGYSSFLPQTTRHTGLVGYPNWLNPRKMHLLLEV